MLLLNLDYYESTYKDNKQEKNYYEVILMRRFFRVHPQRIVRNKPNFVCFQHEYRRSDDGKYVSVWRMVREKIDAKTDRWTDGQTKW